ncbi:MAG: transcriptional repressor [Symbiobacterium sp.]|uniref:Fur family transcriptional regulator n=1 Tax=Symbiobacterium sp. TaxID=1971213 RepID=UPI003463A5FB
MTPTRNDTADMQHEDSFSAGLRAAGLKLTAQRSAICKALADMAGKHHPTVQEIFEAARRYHSGVSLATVYNTLTVLKERGLLYELGPDAAGAVHYELDVDTHINVVCIRCKRVIDLPHVSTGMEEAVARQTGFRVIGAQMLYYGICPACSGEGVAD